MSVSVWSHPLYQWYNTHSIYDITSTAYMAKYALYMTSHPPFITSQHSTHDFKVISHLTLIISDSTSTVSLSSYPDYQSYNPHCTYCNTATICMTSCEPHMTSHPLFLISHHAMTSHPLYSCHHTQDTCHCIHCYWTNIYSVLIILHLIYVWHENHYIYDIRNFIWQHTHSLWHNNSIFFTSHPLCSWQHTHYIWHHILHTCDTTATESMTRHLLCLWYHTLYIWHLTWCMNDNTTMVSDITLTVSV